MYPIVAPYSLAQKKPNGERECEGVQNGYEKVNGTQTEWISNDIQRIQNGSKKKEKSVLQHKHKENAFFRTHASKLRHQCSPKI